MSLPRRVHAVVFDMDGLLVDTETLFREAMMEAAGAMGRELPEQLHRRLIGGALASERATLAEHFGPGFVLDDYYRQVRARYDELVKAGVVLKAGVVELLDHLDAAGLPCAIATSSPHTEVDRNLRPHGLKDRFRAVIARGDYERGKPHPDPFLKAAQALDVPPVHCLALEDSHNGVRAAHAAGMMTVMVPDLLEPTAEMQTLCVRILKSLHEAPGLIASAPQEEEA
jgi:HAD superfamily hydrolase (TIGR01509 family)